MITPVIRATSLHARGSSRVVTHATALRRRRRRHDSTPVIQNRQCGHLSHDEEAETMLTIKAATDNPALFKQPQVSVICI